MQKPIHKSLWLQDVRFVINLQLIKKTAKKGFTNPQICAILPLGTHKTQQKQADNVQTSLLSPAMAGT